MTEFHLENPNNGQSEEAFSRIDNDGIQDVLTRTTKAFASWRETDIDTRAAVLEKTADIYEKKTDELADHIGREMGKPTDQAKAELQIVVDIYRYYAQHAHELLADKELYSDDAQRTFVAKEPLGPLVGVMPWNFPYYQVARFAAPNLLLGNTIVLKHASICPLSSQACQDIFAEAGLPDDVFINVYASGKQVAEFLEDKRIKGVSLTGSEVAGASVAETAGKHLKKSLLELGGNDPFIVLDDSNLEWVLDQYVAIRMTNTGQVCNAPKRLIVMEDIYDRVLDYLTEKIGNLKPGAYNEPDADFGPLSSVGARDEVVETITAAEQNGDARIVVGGDKLDREGAYMNAALLTDVNRDADIAKGEVFGPVALLFKVKDVEEAVELANDVDYGLGGSVWGSDVETAEKVARRLECGMSLVNEASTIKPDLPFGGIGRSGYGRELNEWGVEEFVNQKLYRFSTQDYKLSQEK